MNNDNSNSSKAIATFNRMGVGGYSFVCPTKKELSCMRKAPTKNGFFTCNVCGEVHKAAHGRMKHFSNYL